MTDEPIRSQEFNRAVDSLASSILAVRGEIASLREDLGGRIDRLETRYDEALGSRLEDAKEEGRLQGRLEAVEERLNRQDSWRLATIAPGIVALLMMVLEWWRSGGR